MCSAEPSRMTNVQHRSEAGPALYPPQVKPRSTVSVALLGAPNVGKSTLFNLLTGLSQHAGNWPNTTVEVKRGVHNGGNRSFEIVSLPPVYSLTASSPDEQVVRECLVKEKPDAVVVILNAANLEHTLYLVSEVLELSSPVIVAINMMDVARRQGIRIEEEVLQAALGVPVVAMSASSGEGVADLLDGIGKLARGEVAYAPRPLELDPHLGTLVDRVERLLDQQVPSPYPTRWMAMKLLEGDREVTQMAQVGLAGEQWERLHTILRENEDAVVAVASARYEWIERMVRAALFRPRHGVVSLTERLDRAATHPSLGPLVLLGLLGLLFWLVYAIATPLVGLLDEAMSAGGEALAGYLTDAPPWVAGLLIDGVLTGVGTVISLLPILVVFFLGMGVLQHVGYMARAAFVADRFMHLMGLHGESLIPLSLGFGCNVPAVFGARLINCARARLLTVLLTPLVPCTGRMAVLLFLAGALFGPSAPLVAFGLVALNLIVLTLMGILLNRLVLYAERPALIVELPLYHLPNWRAIALETWQNIKEFLVRAGTVILVVSIAVWALSDQPSGRIEESYLSYVGRFLEPLGGLMGLDWRMMVALLTSFVAKENALATMAVLFGAGHEGSLTTILPQVLAPAAVMAYLVLQVSFIPCAPTVSAIQQQTRSWGWTAFTVAYLLVLSLLLGIATYQAARLLGWGVS